MEVPKSVGMFVVSSNDSVHGVLDEGMPEVSLGVPDVLVQFQDAIDVRSELWCVETSFSQPRDDAIRKLQRIANRSTRGVIAVTLIDITESPPYSDPSDTSATASVLADRTSVMSRPRWVHKANKSLSNSTSVVVYQHPWVSTITTTVTTWLRQPDGQLDLSDYRAQYYAHGVSQLPPSCSIDL